MRILNFEILHTYLGLAGIVENCISATWAPQFQDKGSFNFTVPYSAKMREILIKDNFVTRKDDDNVGIIRSVAIKDEIESQYIVVKGEFATGILGQRIVMNKGEVSGTKEIILKKIIRDNLIGAEDENRNYSKMVSNSRANVTIKSVFVSFVTHSTYTSVLLSDDLFHWRSAIERLDPCTINDIAFGNNISIAVGDDGSIVKSDYSCEAWEKVENNFSAYNFRRIVFGGNKWVAFGEDGTTNAFFESTDGYLWIKRDSGFYVNDISYGDGLFIAVGYEGSNSKIATSTDGTNWTFVDGGFGTSNIYAAVYGGGMWVAVGHDKKLATSTDGVNWTQRDIGAPSGDFFLAIRDVCYARNLWVIVGVKGFATSTNGINWTFIEKQGGSGAYKIAYGCSTFLASIGGYKYLSVDGINWTAWSSSLSNFFPISVNQTYAHTEIETQNFYGNNLLSACKKILKNTSYGIRAVIRKAKFPYDATKTYYPNLELDLYEGVDRRYSQSVNNRVLFSDTEDNLFVNEYETSTERLKNVALVLGEGDGEDKLSLIVGSAAGRERYETAVNAQSQTTENGTLSAAEYAEVLKSTGKAALSLETDSFAGSVINTNNYKYREDYNIGDIVTLRNSRIGVSVDIRVMGVTETEDEEGYNIIPILGLEEESEDATSEIDGEVNTKLYKKDVVNNLTNDTVDAPLSAAMGKELLSIIESEIIENAVGNAGSINLPTGLQVRWGSHSSPVVPPGNFIQGNDYFLEEITTKVISAQITPVGEDGEYFTWTIKSVDTERMTTLATNTDSNAHTFSYHYLVIGY